MMICPETFRVSLRYRGRMYAYTQSAYPMCGRTAYDAIALFYAHGNLACDCARADAIAEHCDEDFIALNCGHTIELLGIEPVDSMRVAS